MCTAQFINVEKNEINIKDDDDNDGGFRIFITIFIFTVLLF